MGNYKNELRVKNNIAVGALFLAVFCSALIGFTNAELTKYLPTFVQITIRSLLIVMVFLVAYRIWFRIGWKMLFQVGIKDWGLAMGRGFINILAIYFFIDSLKLTSYSNVYLIQSLPFIPLLGFGLFGEKITWPKVLAIILSFTGVAILGTSVGYKVTFGSGEMFSLLSCLLFSIFFVSRKYVNQRIGNREVTFMTFVATGICSFGLSMLIERQGWVASSLLDWRALGLLLLNTVMMLVVVGGVVVGFGILESVRAGIIYSLETPIAVLFGVIFLGDNFGLKEVVGMVLVLGSIGIINEYYKIDLRRVFRKTTKGTAIAKLE